MLGGDGCAYSRLAGEVESDGQCVVWSDPVNIIDRSNPPVEIAGMYSSDVSLGMVTNILPEYRSQGYTTAVIGGEVVYSDGENTYKTGVPAAFDEDAYSHDIIGTKRSRAFGCCTDVSVIPKQAISGDINGDGAVDVLDAVMVQKYAVELIELNDQQLIIGDVNGDGVVDALDAALIQQYTVGKI